MEALLSSPVLTAVVASIAAVLSARVAFADVTLKRRLETAQRFTELAEVANNVDGKRGIYEQIAAIELLASFGRSEPQLRGAARAVLDQIKNLGEHTPGAPLRTQQAAVSARRRVPDHDGPLNRADRRK